MKAKLKALSRKMEKVGQEEDQAKEDHAKVKLNVEAARRRVDAQLHLR